jgi:hypothetical protein
MAIARHSIGTLALILTGRAGAEKQTGKVTEVLQFNVSSDDRTLVFTALKPGTNMPSLTLVYDRQ